MRKSSKQIICAFLIGFSLFSCESGVLLNSEADIIQIVLPDDMKAGEAVFIKQTNKIMVPKIALSPEDIAILDQQLKSLAPQFILNEGASISYNGIPKDFSQMQVYTVTSEDGKWTKDYEVSFLRSRLKRSLVFILNC
jgi:hypothetical protein